MKTKFLLGLMSLLSFTVAACGSTPEPVPLSPHVAAEPELTLVWVGRGETERFEKGAWVRVPAFDYDFSVEQRRYGDHWESVKSLRRRHPDYDGSAGPRAQTYFFGVRLGATGSDVPLTITSTLGDGKGTADPEFRRSTLELRAAVSSFAPFDTYRITQSYRYEEGILEELVELDDHGKPWVRTHEHAKLFAESRFPGAPTRRAPVALTGSAASPGSSAR
jgi:hypothetical protein